MVRDKGHQFTAIFDWINDQLSLIVSVSSSPFLQDGSTKIPKLDKVINIF